MKQKLIKLLSLLLLMVVGMSSALADTVVLSSPAPSDKNTLSDKDGIVTLKDDGAKGGIQDGSGTIESVTPLKLSGSRLFTLTYSSDVTINSVKVYATTNSTDAGTAGTSGSDKTSYGEVPAKGATPVAITLTGKSGEGLVFSTQSLAVIVVDYTSNNAGKTISSEIPTAVKINGVTVEGLKFTDGVANVTESSMLAPTVAITTLITYTDNTTANGNADVEVKFDSEANKFVATSTIGGSKYTVNIPAKEIGKTLADVTASTVWDWSKTGLTAIQLTDETRIAKTSEFIASNLIPNTETFNSDALKVQAEYAVRDGKYMQGGKVTIHTTVAGTIKVSFSNTGDRKGDESLTRYLYVNGVKTMFGSNNGTAITTDEIEVEAGDVILTSKMPSSEADQYIRLYSIAFTAASQGGDEPGEEPGDDEPGDDPTDDDPSVDPSTAKLLWDYTEKAPSDTSDNGLTYAGTVNDAAGTNNGLKGIKLNSSGYAYFTKAAVKGTLKLTYGPRKDSNASSLGIYTFTKDGETVTKGAKIGVTKEVTELSTDAIELTAEQNNIYIIREASVEQVLTKVEFVPFVERTFKDFELNFVNVTALPATPAGVTSMEGTPRGDAHGLDDFKMVLPVDGAVKITFGGCQYSNTEAKILDETGATIASVDVKIPDCYHNGGTATYIYTGDKNVLTIIGAQYTSYIKAEAIEVAPCKVTYKDQEGKVINTVDTFEGEALGTLPSAEGITVPSGYAFRGWVYASGAKAKATDLLNGNTTITAKVTSIESVTLGSVQTYNLASNIFYPEDHETISIEGGYYHDATHGWALATDSKVSIDVAGNAQVILSLCKFSKDAPITVTNAEGNVVATITSAYNENDGALATVQYSGPATTLTFTFAKGESYLHKVTVYNVKEFLAKDETTGWYIVPANDAAAFLLALNSANAETGATIFLPNGTYDLGNTVLTTISGNNMSIIGESMEGTIIKTTALEEKLGVADLFYNTSTGLYMQDLTLQNDFDYYNSGSAGRAAVLQDNGTKTILRNVAMRSYQDTYYSKSGNYYFEGGLIQGTVDYICGGGNAWFEDITLLNKSRYPDKEDGDDTMTAYQGTGKYIFNNCSVESECSTFNFGRSWGDAYVVYLNTTIKSGKLVDTRFLNKDMNSAPRFFGEYNTTDLSGNGKNTPASNHLVTDKGGDFESVLTAEQAASYTLESLFGTWDPKTIAAQADADIDNIDEEALYLIEDEGKFVAIIKGSDFTADVINKTIRKANARGGFGKAVKLEIKTVDVTIDEYKYVTFYNESAVLIPGDDVPVYAKAVYYDEAANKFVVADAYEPGDVIPAKTPVVLYSETPETYSLILTGVENAAPEDNDLLGSSEDTETSELVSGNEADYYYYALSLNADNEIGFYWMNSEGAAFTNGAGKAFLAVKKSVFDSEVRGFSFNNGATSIQSVESTSSAKIYDLTGREVRNAVKGVYIMNGKKYIK